MIIHVSKVQNKDSVQSNDPGEALLIFLTCPNFHREFSPLLSAMVITNWFGGLWLELGVSWGKGTYRPLAMMRVKRDGELIYQGIERIPVVCQGMDYS